MNIYIIRHAKVDIKVPEKCNAKKFDAFYAFYDTADIIRTGIEKSNIACNRIYVSGLFRSRATASLLFPDQEVTEIWVEEVPLKSFMNTDIQFPFRVWKVIGRLQWRFNIRRQDEVRKETTKRCMGIIDMLEEKNEDCVIVTHRFFMRNLIRCLKMRGYELEDPKGKIANLQVVTAKGEK